MSDDTSNKEEANQYRVIVIGELPLMGPNDIIEMAEAITRYSIVTIELSAPGKYSVRMVRPHEYATYNGLMYQIDRPKDEKAYLLTQVKMQFGGSKDAATL